MNSSLVSNAGPNERFFLSPNLALKGAFGRIESGVGFSAMHVRAETGYSDSSGGEGSWNDGDHSDGHDDSSEYPDSSI